MTELLQRAFLLASTKSEEEQNALALALLDGLEEDLSLPSCDGAREGATRGRSGAGGRRAREGAGRRRGG